ncbi:carbohydrate kinase family protein [Microbacterium sp. A196]|uniref:carbohydrate kinase family protein n=1 Tax=unclassified Microbacterium TaxID=2609290 RepID=UPI003FCF5056
MLTSPRAVVIGDALIDEIHDAGGIRELVGGAALNVAVGMRRLGVQTSLVAMVGDDEAGEHIREYLVDHDVQLIESVAPRGSSRAVVQRDAGGEPTYVFNEAAQRRSIRYGKPARQSIAAADLVVISCFPFDNPVEVDALVAALGDARVAIDPNPRTGMLRSRDEFVRGFERVASGAAIVKVGADDARLLYDGDLERLRTRLRELGSEAVLATAGKEGAVLDVDSGTLTASIVDLPGPIIDTVGAGDATLASVAEGLVDARPASAEQWQALLDSAMEVAAATCRSEGGLLRTAGSLADAERGVHGS